MHILRLALLIALLASIGPVCIAAQALGALDVRGKALKIDGKSIVARKRFYLFRGGLKDNQDLIARLRTAEIKSRDCFYTQMKASPQYICWLQAENCESPFCRTVATDDVARVPEFQAAYKKSLVRFPGLTSIARDWITTNMPDTLTSGFFRERRTLTSSLMGNLKPVQSTMTDSTTIQAIFIDIPVNPPAGKKTETFLISNILPLEFGTKTYLWACEVEIGAEKKAVFNLALPTADKPVKNCEVFIRDLQVCKTGACQAK